MAGERVQIGGQRRGIGLAFAGLHLRDVALVQDHPSHYLHVELTVADGAHRRLADGGESLRQQIVQRFAFAKTAAELVGLLPEPVIGEHLHGRLQGGDPLHRRSQAPCEFFGSFFPDFLKPT